MFNDEDLLGEAYLQHCTSADLQFLAAATGDQGGRIDRLRSNPASVAALVSDDRVARGVFDSLGSDAPLFPASPFLVFAVAVAQTAHELAGASYVEEWRGPRRRAPGFDVNGLRLFLADGWKRLFLAELLGSYTHVTSGSIAVATRRGMRRRRFSELDPVRLSGLLEVVAETEHPGIYRRLGDLALFLTGVFPDHTALHGWSGPDRDRLLRAGRIDPRRATVSQGVPGFGDASAVELLERLGRRWYRLAHDLVPPPRPRSLAAVGDLADAFTDARRVLNVVTDRYLFPIRTQLFGGEAG